ncbi:MAG: NAD-dependent epimerase/dehydratase family protein [Pseudomonadota bacterium]|nr:NAD-dependent epimerase/dehydratase family protein [Pseudomonadota bacterium]
MKRRVAITGATGFVGRQVVRRLLEQGCEVVTLVRSGAAVDMLSNDVVTICCGDLFGADVDALEEALLGSNILVHCAWYSEPGQYISSPKNYDCLHGSINLFRAAVNAGVEKIVGLGTCLEYDLRSGYVAADSPLKPETLYAFAKAACYVGLQRLVATNTTEALWCRVFYLFGEGEDERRLVPYVRKCLAKGQTVDLTDGSQIRDYLDVANAGNMIADYALGDQTGAANICSGIPISIRDFVTQIASEQGREHLLNFGARPFNEADPPIVVGIP